MDLLETAARTIRIHRMLRRGDEVVVGVSGGPDSLCLLHILNRLQERLGIGLRVAHLDHGMRGAEGEADAAFVADLAAKWALPITVEARDVVAIAAKERLSPEEAARRVRYRFLADVAHRHGAEAIAVGHHADDHVETILMHWLRGAAAAGLRGIRPVRALPVEGEGEAPRLIRPLWQVSRREIDAYCARHHLEPRADASNLETRYYRNRIRHELLPQLETYNPQIRRNLRRAAEVFSDDFDHLRREADAAWESSARVGRGYVRFDRGPWSQLHRSLQRMLLRRTVRELRPSLRDLEWIHVEQALESIRDKRAGSRIALPAGLGLTVGYDEFVVGDSLPHPDLPRVPAGSEIGFAVPERVPLDGWTLIAEFLPADPGIHLAKENQDPWQAFIDEAQVGGQLWLRGRRTGDRFRPLGMAGHSKRVGQFMIDAKIPAHLRAEIPIVASRGHIVWIAGYRIDERAGVHDGTERVVRLRFEQGNRDGA
ncbi:MAG: tRNA lysidine(34) synthetase TilS [Anaerolineae bacterium]